MFGSRVYDYTKHVTLSRETGSLHSSWISFPCLILGQVADPKRLTGRQKELAFFLSSPTRCGKVASRRRPRGLTVKKDGLCLVVEQQVRLGKGHCRSVAVTHRPAPPTLL
ncbi:MAG: hypothetical protein ACYDGU_13745, partial [Acidiferrobacterales bacterium]